MTRVHANGLLLFAGAIWGMAFVTQKSAMDHVGPFLFIACRFAVATLVVLPFAYIESRRACTASVHAAARADGGQPPLRLADWAGFILIGTVLFVGMASQQHALLTTSVTNSGFLTGLYVVFTPLLGIALFRDWPHWVVWPAVLLAMLGVFLLSGGDLSALTVGDVQTIFSALCWGLQVVLIARFVGQSHRPLALSATQFAVTGFLAAIVALVFEPVVWSDIVAASPEILYAGVFASGVAFTLQVIGQRYTSPAQAAIFLSSEAPFAALFGAIYLHERLGLPGFLGCCLIFSAMLATELVPMLTKRFARTSAAA